MSKEMKSKVKLSPAWLIIDDVPQHTSKDTSVKTGRLTDSRCLRKSLSSHELSTKLSNTHSKSANFIELLQKVTKQAMPNYNK